MILTDVSDLRKDVLKYYCMRYSRHDVYNVLFTADESLAVAVFSPPRMSSKPGISCYVMDCVIDRILTFKYCWPLINSLMMLYSSVVETSQALNLKALGPHPKSRASILLF